MVSFMELDISYFKTYKLYIDLSEPVINLSFFYMF